MTNNDILTTAEVVELHGSKKCKEYFAKNKKLGGHKDSLHKTLEEIYVKWEVVNVGRSNGYKLGEKRLQRLARQDGRINNGNREQMPYKEIIQNLILIYLNEGNRKPSTTYKVLAHDLEIMSDVLFFASKKVTVEEQKDYYQNLDAKYKERGHVIFWDIVNMESQRIKRHVESVLKDMKEKKIIRHMDVVNAVSLDKFGREIHNPITVVEVAKIDKMKKNLREAHDVTVSDIRYKPKSDAVVAYKKDEYEYLQSLGYEYVYNAIYINLIATDKEIKNYMKNNLLVDFKNSHLDFAYLKALARENSFFNDVVKVKDNHKLVELFGGKKKSEVYKETLTAYDMIDMDELMNDGIKQEKFNHTYASSYKESLKTIQDVEGEVKLA